MVAILALTAVGTATCYARSVLLVGSLLVAIATDDQNNRKREPKLDCTFLFISNI
jgi:hypothetical protein